MQMVREVLLLKIKLKIYWFQFDDEDIIVRKLDLFLYWFTFFFLCRGLRSNDKWIWILGAGTVYHCALKGFAVIHADDTIQRWLAIIIPEC